MNRKQIAEYVRGVCPNMTAEQVILVTDRLAQHPEPKLVADHVAQTCTFPTPEVFARVELQFRQPKANRNAGGTTLARYWRRITGASITVPDWQVVAGYHRWLRGMGFPPVLGARECRADLRAAGMTAEKASEQTDDIWFATKRPTSLAVASGEGRPLPP